MGVILFGAPGAGKGTQAVGLAQRIGATHISTGDLFRAHVSGGTELGRTAQRHLDAGRYVPDEVTNAMVSREIVDDAFILDGYPRTPAQVEHLDGLLAALGVPAPAVIALTVRPDELIRRLADRSRTAGRTDDDAAVVRQRQAVYQAQTAPLLSIYRRRGALREVDGMGGIDEVALRIDAALQLSRPRLDA
jgi:adenylate kinase